MRTVGLIGTRGMVGSVLVQRMLEENDFNRIEPVFASTSMVGKNAHTIGDTTYKYVDANDLNFLSDMDIIVTCQGGSYSKKILPALRKNGWKGFWIDSASTFRMDDNAVIVLDPVNKPLINEAVEKGIRNYIGGNCTVSLMLMAVHGLFKEKLVKWISCVTYQSASGAGAAAMRELVAGMRYISQVPGGLVENPETDILKLDKAVTDSLRDEKLPQEILKVPLAGSLIPWIDKEMNNGQSREEWKGKNEVNKILGGDPPVPVDGICVRVPVMRCHSQALTIKLAKDVSIKEIEKIISTASKWVKVVPNKKEDSVTRLTPAFVAGSLDILAGRIRKLNVDSNFLTLFTVGDQLLWGAAEPIRRMLKILNKL